MYYFVSSVNHFFYNRKPFSFLRYKFYIWSFHVMLQKIPIFLPIGRFLDFRPPLLLKFQCIDNNIILGFEDLPAGGKGGGMGIF